MEGKKTNWICEENTERNPRVALWLFVANPVTAAQCIHCLTDELKGSSSSSCSVTFLSVLSRVPCKSLFVIKAPFQAHINSTATADVRLSVCVCKCHWPGMSCRGKKSSAW